MLVSPADPVTNSPLSAHADSSKREVLKEIYPAFDSTEVIELEADIDFDPGIKDNRAGGIIVPSLRTFLLAWCITLGILAVSIICIYFGAMENSGVTWLIPVGTSISITAFSFVLVDFAKDGRIWLGFRPKKVCKKQDDAQDELDKTQDELALELYRADICPYKENCSAIGLARADGWEFNGLLVSSVPKKRRYCDIFVSGDKKLGKLQGDTAKEEVEKLSEGLMVKAKKLADSDDYVFSVRDLDLSNMEKGKRKETLGKFVEGIGDNHVLQKPPERVGGLRKPSEESDSTKRGNQRNRLVGAFMCKFCQIRSVFPLFFKPASRHRLPATMDVVPVAPLENPRGGGDLSSQESKEEEA